MCKLLCNFLFSGRSRLWFHSKAFEVLHAVTLKPGWTFNLLGPSCRFKYGAGFRPKVGSVSRNFLKVITACWIMDYGVHPQNIRFHNVQFQNVRFQNVRNVQSTKSQVFKTSGFPKLQYYNKITYKCTTKGWNKKQKDYEDILVGRPSR
jgi:hypothetical protein